MSKKFSISEYDLKKIAGKIHDYDQVKNNLVKVAFDIYRMKDDPAAKLWELQKSDDGSYIVALYSDSEELEKTSEWEVEINKSANNVNFYYKGDYVTKLNAKDIGLPVSEAKEILPERLASNKKLVSLLLNKIDINTRKTLVSKYPELA